MGTRNITRVIASNQLKVCQYGQWDGYPTGAGRDVIDFIRETDDDHMIERLGHVTLVSNAKGDTFAGGAPFFEEANAIAKDEWDFRDVPRKEFTRMHPRNDTSATEEWEYVQRRVREMLLEKYGPELMQMWYVSVRDTGCKILPLIYDSTNDLTVYAEGYTVNNFGDWQIEAVWQLDYDTKTLTGWWHGDERSWTFAELRKADTKEIDEMLEEYEKAGWED